MLILQASDIKIGNFIATSGNPQNEETWCIGKVLQINSEETEFEQVYCECEESFEWFFKDNYFGIPLTNKNIEKYLLNYKSTSLGYVIDIHKYQSLVLNSDYDVYLRDISREDGSMTYIDDVVCIWNNDIKKRSMCLHELQNIYHALATKELTINF